MKPYYQVPCGDCIGQGVGPEGACEACGGRGWQIDRPARAVLIDEVLPPHSSSILDDLNANRPALLAWLQEIELIRPTGYALELVPRDPTVASWEKGWQPERQRVVPVADAGENARRLWTVKP